MIAPLLLLLYYLAFAGYDLFRGRSRPGSRTLRLAACAAGVLFCLRAIGSSREVMAFWAVSPLVANVVLLMAPSQGEDWKRPLRAALMVTLPAFVIILFMEEAASAAIWALCCAGCAVMLVSRLRRRLSRVSYLFRASSVWSHLEDHTRYLMSAAVILCGFPLCLAPFCREARVEHVLYGAGALLSSLLFAVLYGSSRSGRSLIMRESKEDQIKGLINGNLKDKVREMEEEENRMTELYGRIQSVMDLRKPFLSDSFTLNDLAALVLTNKTYLSRTINIQSGRNFCQFVNWYRVQYAQSLMRRNPRLKVHEISSMSGFHSVPSFNMAFKANTGLTPTLWKQQEWEPGR